MIEIKDLFKEERYFILAVCQKDTAPLQDYYHNPEPDGKPTIFKGDKYLVNSWSTKHTESGQISVHGKLSPYKAEDFKFFIIPEPNIYNIIKEFSGDINMLIEEIYE